MDVGVTHPMHEGGQGDASPDQVGSKSVPKPMRIGVGDATAHTMMPEQRSEPGGGHRLTALAAFQTNE
jgi:hypothetical protein